MLTSFAWQVVHVSRYLLQVPRPLSLKATVVAVEHAKHSTVVFGAVDHLTLSVDRCSVNQCK